MFSPNAKRVERNIPYINLGEHQIERVNVAKFLGIYINDELRWDAHIKHVSHKLASGNYAINSVKHLLSTSNLKQLYFSLIHSHLQYGIILWGSAFDYQLKKLCTLQKRAIRNVCNVKYNSPSNDLFKKLHVPKLTDIYGTSLGKLMYHTTNNDLPDSLAANFRPNHIYHNHHTRQRNDPHFRRHTSSIINKSFLHSGPSI